VKLLLDENLSPRLLAAIIDLFPDSSHIEECGLKGTTDAHIWQYALDHGFTIVSKDSDFADRSALLGGPPKVIWLRIGNCTTARAEFVLINLASRIQDFLLRGEESCLVLRHPR
jgi:predicted nuclease of predicted toxin-antitoxin system